jgi:hypothetical protein
VTKWDPPQEPYSYISRCENLKSYLGGNYLERIQIEREIEEEEEE